MGCCTVLVVAPAGDHEGGAIGQLKVDGAANQAGWLSSRHMSEGDERGQGHADTLSPGQDTPRGFEVT